LDKCKELLSFFPSNNKEKPPRIETKDDPEREILELDSIIPDEPTKPYNMYTLIKKVVDDEYFVEIFKDYAKSAICGFARMNGRPVGITSNQPMIKAGILDIDACDKLARFIRFCDLFNIALVSLVDCPAYMIGSDQDWKGILRHGAKLLYCWSEATVPLVSVIIRKSFAGAHYGMLDKGIGADFVFAWPTARVTIVGADTAASVIFAREIREAENPKEIRAKRIKEYSELYESPYPGAERGYIDDIIMPHDTRKIVNRTLDILEHKEVIRPWRKYSNINL
jgi:acetyl-CoA carboxylase carboxyltransferase component